jgi:hypothetical protein
MSQSNGQSNHTVAAEPDEVRVPTRAWRFVREQWPLLLIALAALLAAAIALRSQYFPYSKENVAKSLLKSFPGELKFDRFEPTYFPRPGCKAEGVTFRLPLSAMSVPPLVIIRKMTIQGNYLALLFHPRHAPQMVLEGLHVQVLTPGNVGVFPGGHTTYQTPSTK